MKAPFIVKLIIFLTLVCILTALSNLVHIFNRNGLYLSLEEFNIIFGLVVAFSTLAGIAFVNLFRNWTSDSFISRQDNPVEIDRLVLLLYERKMQLYGKMKAKPPSFVQVKLKEEEEKKK